MSARWVIAAALCWAACGDRPVFGPGPDASDVDADVQADAAPGRDAAVETDAGSESDAGAGTDAAAVADTGTDAGATGIADAGHDAGIDAGMDGGTDAGHDGGPPHAGPPGIDLGSEGDPTAPAGYVVLGRTALSNAGGSRVEGNVGLSPGGEAMITGFSLVRDASGQFSSSPSVVSPFHVYAASHASPTPASVARAVSRMRDAYADAASRTAPSFVDLVGGHLGALTMLPGLYRWTTSVDVSALGITLLGGPNDVWIFQIEGDLELAADATVTLAGGADVHNVLWQVQGHVLLDPRSRAEGILLSAQTITLQAGATLHGRALGQSVVALDDGDVIPP